MDEVREFCRRVLGADAPADEAAQEALASGAAERLDLLAAAARACRARAEATAPYSPPVAGDGAAGSSLAVSIALELALASSKLPERHREVLALRELLRLSHDQIARVMGIDAAAVAPLLARARLRLRAERRGGDPGPDAGCGERDRALRVLVRRHDSEPLSAEDDAWLLAHLGSCDECSRAHGALLEASVCYRAWRQVP